MLTQLQAIAPTCDINEGTHSFSRAHKFFRYFSFSLGKRESNKVIFCFVIISSDYKFMIRDTIYAGKYYSIKLIEKRILKENITLYQILFQFYFI